jgi:serine protease AprX
MSSLLKARVRRCAGTAVAFLVVATPLGTPAHASAGPVRWADVVVTGAGPDAAAAAVTAAGGRVIARLPVVRGVAAALPAGTDLGPQWTVAPARELHVASVPSGGTAATGPVRAALGLPATGNEGRGETVAVVDTGIADVPDLAGRVSARVDLTGTGAGDGFGHGTFMAGLIGASGAASGGEYRGAAPGAKLVDVKVADASGHTDLITVLRGLEWVAEHAPDVDVVNLSLSSYSPLPYQLDPLTQALEALWRKGITVVVPSGNDGPAPGSVTSPGTDPVLLTAGGLDASGTGIAVWSGRGPTWQGDAKPDLAAPGTSLVSLRSPGSAVDVANPGARIGTEYFVGSGTSMATAVTSAVAADALSVAPRLRPDAVKGLLVGTASAGRLDAGRVLTAAPAWKNGPQDDKDAAAIRADAKQWAAFAAALVANDRAAAYVAWQRLSQASRDWAGRAWAQLDQATRDWVGRAWAGRAWASGPDGTAEEWLGRAWAGRAWAGRAWADADWAGRAWAGRAWADSDWAGRAWADSDWAGRAWADSDWAGRAWASDAWSARAWAWLS